jgi:hypothetical protein
VPERERQVADARPRSGLAARRLASCDKLRFVTNLLLAEEIFLLTHNDDSGRTSGALAIDAGLAGALLMDLAAQELVDTDGEAITPVAGTASHPLLASAHAELLQGETRTAKQWVVRLPKVLKPLRSQVGQSLVERGVLTQQKSRILGLFPTTRWPQADPAPEQDLHRRLIDVLVDGAEPDPHMALLISLMSSQGLVRRVVDKDHRKQAESRAKDITANNANTTATAAIAHAVKVLEGAMVAAAGSGG